MIVLDVDGVMTDGRLIYGSDGTDYRIFDVKDGYGIARAIKNNFFVAIISRGKSKSVDARAKRLGISEVYQGVMDKRTCLDSLITKNHLTSTEVCCVGDDDPDLPMLHLAGFSAAPADAMPAVSSSVDYVARATGGRGAVREIIDLILNAQGLI